MALQDSEDEDESEESEEEPAAAPKKKNTSSFMALQDSEDEDESEESEEEPAAAPKKKNTSSFMALQDSEDEDESSEEAAPAPAPAPAKGANKGKRNTKKNKKKVDTDEDEDAMLAAAIAANQQNQPAPAQGGKRNKGKKGKRADVDDEDEDAILAAAIAANSSEVAEVANSSEVAEVTSKVEDLSVQAEAGAGGKKGRKRGGKKKKAGAEEDNAHAPAKQTARGRAIAEAMEKQRAKAEAEAAAAAAAKAAEEEEAARVAAEEAAIEQEKQRKKAEKAAKRDEMKAQGLLKTKKQKEQEAAAARRAEMLRAKGLAPQGITAEGGPPEKKKKVVYGKKKPKQNNSAPTDKPPAQTEAPAPEPEPEPEPAPAAKKEKAWDDSSSDEDEPKPEPAAAEEPEPEQSVRRAKKPPRPKAKPGEEELRSPICCILGHVDTGKTKLLDKIRRTNVQDGEAGGITQQIGATYFPSEAINKATARLRERKTKMQIKVPGLLIIDTPGHESFSNLRQRGSSLCDIAILVVDITGGLEKQTIESLQLLLAKKCPFIVALNKIDRMYDWQIDNNAPFEDTFEKQKDYVQAEFNERLKKVMTEFAEHGVNACLYTENKDYENYVSLVPTSAHTGEGIPDLLGLITVLSQRTLVDRIEYQDEVQATVLEVKVIEGLGTTIDIILVNGEMHANDEIVVCGMNGPIHTKIRALMTPQPMKEIRVKGQYMHHKSIKAAMGIKIAAPGLEQAVACLLYTSPSPRDS
eukprot:TRINITY_DN2497_c0_g1_i12.p1 TRINITY_DN2497_c0_g1~~TRINITY_DN2497_c0_g1_i12.p1  ORF type:complete len:749 (-),score=281.37 TRINITY_DN2497_c0_g1_i12:97-2343(-)